MDLINIDITITACGETQRSIMHGYYKQCRIKPEFTEDQIPIIRCHNESEHTVTTQVFMCRDKIINTTSVTSLTFNDYIDATECWDIKTHLPSITAADIINQINSDMDKHKYVAVTVFGDDDHCFVLTRDGETIKIIDSFINCRGISVRNFNMHKFEQYLLTDDIGMSAELFIYAPGIKLGNQYLVMITLPRSI